MGNKLSPRQLVQLAWLEQLPRKFDRMTKVIEMLSTHHAEETQLRGLIRLLEELKAQGGSVGVSALADNFGYMAMLLRRAGGHQVKVRGLQELLAGAKTNFEGAMREATSPDPALQEQQAKAAEDEISP